MRIKIKKLSVFLFWVTVWVCCVSVAYGQDISKEKLHARCAAWAYLQVNNLEDDQVKKHMEYTKGKMTLDQYMYEVGYAEGFVNGASFSLRLPPDRIANDLYNKYCLNQEISKEVY